MTMKKNNPQNVVSFSITGIIRELTGPRLDQSASWLVHELAVPELAYPRGLH